MTRKKALKLEPEMDFQIRRFMEKWAPKGQTALVVWKKDLQLLLMGAFACALKELVASTMRAMKLGKS